jgi:hypothetical protein
MIRKIDESEKKLFSFKKFSELSKKTKDEDVDGELSVMPQSEPPHVPNLPTEKPSKVQKGMNTNYLMPDKGELTDNPLNILESKDDVEFIGKVAKLPRGVKVSKAYNFLENVKVSKSSIWYLMIEKQDNELQMVKYNYKKGVDLSQFVGDLKSYYVSKYKGNNQMIKLIENIQIDGNDKYSWIKNIPLVEVEGRKMISKITEDLIRLLSK